MPVWHSHSNLKRAASRPRNWWKVRIPHAGTELAGDAGIAAIHTEKRPSVPAEHPAAKSASRAREIAIECGIRSRHILQTVWPVGRTLIPRDASLRHTPIKLTALRSLFPQRDHPPSAPKLSHDPAPLIVSNRCFTSLALSPAPPSFGFVRPKSRKNA
jgi:hypothetical protein